MASTHRQARSKYLKMVFHIPNFGPWFRSSGTSNRHLAIIAANVLELEAQISAKHGMTEDSIAHLEQILSDLFEYFNGRKRPAADLSTFVDESVENWKIGVAPKTKDAFEFNKKNFLTWVSPKASSVKALTFSLINDYFKYLNASDYARATVGPQRAFVKRLARRAKELKLVREDPLAGTFVKCKKQGASNAKLHGITNEELEKVYAYLDKEIKSNE